MSTLQTCYGLEHILTRSSQDPPPIYENLSKFKFDRCAHVMKRIDA